MRTATLKVMLGTVIVEVILVCVLILMGELNDVVGRTMLSVAIIFFNSLPCLLYARIYDDEKVKMIAIVGAILTSVAALFGILNVWKLMDISGALEKALSVIEIFVWSLALISWVLSYKPINKVVNIFRNASSISLAVFSLFSSVMVLLEYSLEGFVLRLYYVLMVITTGLFVCMFIVTKIYKKEFLEQKEKKQP